jgi:5-methyltetrahydrofolate--homocysteine methyltransferase
VQDDQGIPKNSEQRVALANKVVERAEAVGIAREDIIIDCLAFAVGADPSSGPAVIEAIRKIKAQLGVNLTLGASNVSFGLPDRNLLNHAFAVMAIAAGVTCLIVDVAKVRPAVVAADLILGRDKHARRYIEDYRQRQRLQERKE